MKITPQSSIDTASLGNTRVEDAYLKALLSSVKAPNPENVEVRIGDTVLDNFPLYTDSYPVSLDKIIYELEIVIGEEYMLLTMQQRKAGINKPNDTTMITTSARSDLLEYSDLIMCYMIGKLRSDESFL